MQLPKNPMKIRVYHILGHHKDLGGYSFQTLPAIIAATVGLDLNIA